jgi:EF-P beta-lysylation protein EpmB
MITRTEKIRQTPIWQQQLANAIQDVDELLRLVKLDAGQLGISETASQQFSLRITREYVSRIRPGQPNDPLLRQILPIEAETRKVDHFVNDPVGDHLAHIAEGVLHKYQGRALLLTTGACAIHCRYCFRRHFPYAEANAARADWSQALDYLQTHDDIHEVILSGGDPLTLTDTRLASLIKKIEKISHINTLRIHTRLPVVLPQRVCDEMLEWLRGSHLQMVIVIHCNHAQEIDPQVRLALNSLKENGAILLNQAVLLRGINNSVSALKALSVSLFEAGVLPYYLHMLDPVAGAAHFDVDETVARELISELQTLLPGYLVPRLVREFAGRLSKTSIA